MEDCPIGQAQYFVQQELSNPTPDGIINPVTRRINTMNAQPAQNEAIASVGIIGGGKVGLQLLNLFSQSHLTRVVYVVDREMQAPAMAAARERQVMTFTDINQALRAKQVDFIFEVTGSKGVVSMLQQALTNLPTQLVTHDMSYILLRVIEENRQRTSTLVRSDIQEIKQSIGESLKAMETTIDSINEITGDLRYLALNARIEAAQAGEHGRGFDIVAQQVERSAQEVRGMTQEIAKVNANIQNISGRIDDSLLKLD
jgi:threonine dehydrogenase-like Zn-dependent dehydrogenase